MHRSRVTESYFGDGSDHRGRSLDQLQTQPVEMLERLHDCIQWLFPLPERSQSNPDALTLSPADIDAFKRSAELRDSLLLSWHAMPGFYGLAARETGGRIEVLRSATFETRRHVWLTPSNHNFLRITRILRSLKLLGCVDESRAFFACLREIYRDCQVVIGQRTYQFWRSKAP